MSQKLLVVDDEPDIADLLSQILACQGYDTRVAREARDAINECADWRPDGVVLDAMLPDMSGFDACLQLRRLEIAKHTAVVMHTALFGAEHRARAFACGADRFISKPAPPEMLTRVIRKAIRQSAGERAGSPRAVWTLEPASPMMASDGIQEFLADLQHATPASHKIIEEVEKRLRQWRSALTSLDAASHFRAMSCLGFLDRLEYRVAARDASMIAAAQSSLTHHFGEDWNFHEPSLEWSRLHPFWD